MSADVVTRAKAVLEGVTDGPWETRVLPMPGATVDEWFVREIVYRPDQNFHPYNVLKVRGAANAARTCCWPPTDADAEFIAAARSLVPELVAELERVTGLQLDDRANAIAAIEERDAANAEVEKLRGALSALVDPDDCWFDHNGDCQAHGFFGERCGHAVAKELLAGAES